MIVKSVIEHLICFWCIILVTNSQPVQVPNGAFPYIVFFVHHEDNSKLKDNNYPFCGTIIHPNFVLTVASYFKINSDITKWAVAGIAMNSVPSASEVIKSAEISVKEFHFGSGKK